MAKAAKAKPATYRTLDARPNAESLVKPGELVDLVEVTPLTLVDRRIYNQLLEQAWEAIDKPVTHVVAKAELRGSHNSNDRIGESIERLMTAIVRVAVVRNGERAVERVQLLGGNLEVERRDGLLEYEIPARLRRIIKDSTVFARLQREVMFALTSKYALTLYEMVQKRGNLSWRSSDRFTIDELRGILGVPKGKLTTWSNLKLRAISPAVKEVSQLSDYIVEIEPIKTGRSVTHVELRWWKKDSAGQGDAARTLSYARPGRGVKRTAQVEALSPASTPVRPTPVTKLESPPKAKPRPARMDRSGPPLDSETYDTARLRYPGYDIYYVESQWRAWSKGKDTPRDPDRAYLAFFRKYAESHPL